MSDVPNPDPAPVPTPPNPGDPRPVEPGTPVLTTPVQAPPADDDGPPR